MKRGNFLKSLLGLIVAPSIIAQIDIDPVKSGNIIWDADRMAIWEDEPNGKFRQYPLTEDECIKAFSGKPVLQLKEETALESSLIYYYNNRNQF